ncbi:MAG: saccharopine dehydrogenase C-terminal domain-containing protein [Thermoplasmata archaeon]
MKKILLLGAGNIGKAIAYDLNKDFKLTIVDSSEKTLDECEKYGDTLVLDVTDTRNMQTAMEDVDAVVCALPGRFGFKVLETAVKCGTDTVDVSFMPEDPFALQEEAKKARVSLVVDAGFGPGLPNVFIGRLNALMDCIQRCMIRIAGLPMDPKPPLFHSVTWSPHDLVEEYTRPARVVRNDRVHVVKPFDEIRPVTVRGMELEEFYSDGLRTLLHTVKVHHMEETTLRWKGHLERIKALDEFGFFQEHRVNDTLDMILPYMVSRDRDISLLEIDVKGRFKGEDVEAGCSLYDEAKAGFSSMARTTGFTTALMTRILLERELPKGVLPLELLGENVDIHDYILEELRARDVEIKVCYPH